MSRLKALVKKYPKLSAALGAGLVAAASAYAPGSGPYVRALLTSIFGG